MKIKEYGDPLLPKVIFVHPMLADGGCMLRLGESMTGSYCFISPDLTGQGEDTKSTYKSAKSEAKELLAYLKEKGYTEIELLMGASLGGVVALYMLADSGVNFKTAVFEGASSYHHAPLLYQAMRLTFLKKHRKAAVSPLSEVEQMLTGKYGVFGKVMAKTFMEMNEKSISAIVRDCTSVDFPVLSPEMQRRMFWEVGSKDLNYKELPEIRRNYPQMQVTVREGYGHCMYLSQHFDSYGAHLEELMKKE